MIERCTDYRRVKKFLDWRMLVSSDVIYLMEIKDGIDLGVWTLHPWHNGLLIHANLDSGCSGKDAKKSATDSFKWAFSNTQYDKIYAKINNDKRHAQFISISAGMRFIDKDTANRYYKITSNDIFNLNSRRIA